MKFGEITNSPEYQMDEQTKICQFLESNYGFPNWEKIPNFTISKIIQFPLLTNSKKNQSSEIVEFQKLANF